MKTHIFSDPNQKPYTLIVYRDTEPHLLTVSSYKFFLLSYFMAWFYVKFRRARCVDIKMQRLDKNQVALYYSPY